MKTRFVILATMIVSLLSACSNQRYVSSETDDLYFSSEDRNAATQNEFATVKSVEGSEFVSPQEVDQESESDYFVKGRATRGDQNPSSEAAYANNYTQASSGIQFDDNDNEVGAQAGAGGTVNNFYGNTTYYEESDNFNDNSYASRIRRFDNVNMGLGYGYYDPFFIDPFWSYGWSYWNPYPRAGWSVGWNSWGGWNVGYNWGWGAGPRWGAGWNNCWGFNDPWCRGGWGAGGWGPGGWAGGWGPGGWGMNNYWNGYNNGYWNGLNDGLWLGAANNNQRGISIGRRDLATDRGFGNGTRAGNDSPNRVVQNTATANRAAGRIESPSPQDRQKDISKNRNSDLLADGSKLYQTGNRSNPRINATASPKRDKMQDVNVNANNAGTRYKSPSIQRPTAVSKEKYNASGLTRTSREQLIDMNRVQQRPQVNTNPNTNQNPNQTRSKTVNPQDRTRTNPNQNYGTPNRNYSTPRDRVNERPRYYTPNNSRSNGQINRSPSNTRPSSPSNVAPSRNYNQGSSRPNTRVNTPNQSRTRSTSPSRSRTYNTPSRSSSPSRSVSPPRSSSPSRSYTPSRSSSPSRSAAPSRPSGGRR